VLVLTGVDIVRVDFAVPLPGVMAAGEKAQLKPATELQESETGLLKLPDRAATVMLRLPDPPAVTARDDGAAPRDKLDVPPELLPQRLDVNAVGDEIWFAILALPTAWT
jgi:hypothetical protein